MANKVYTTMSEESIRYLCGLINQIVSLPTDIISNINLADNLTFSNIHIKDLIDQCLQDAKDHSEAIVNSLTHLVAEKIDFEPTLDNTTNKINTLLLYNKNSDNNYTQYLRLANELLNLGDTSLSLTDYLKITEAASTYTKLTDFKTLSDEVSGIKTKIGSGSLDTTSDTLTGAINEVKGIAEQGALLTVTKTQYDELVAGQTVNIDGKDYTYDSNTYYVVKDDSDTIVTTTTISSSSTDSEVPTAKAVNDLLQTEGSGNLTIPLNEDLNNLIHNRTRVWMNSQTVEIATFTNMPSGKYGECAVIFIPYENATAAYGEQIFVGNQNRIFIRNKVGTTWTDWRRVCTAATDNVVKGSVTLNSGYSGSVTYSVINGWCSVRIDDLKVPSSATTGGSVLSNTTLLPARINDGVVWGSITSVGSDGTSILVHVNNAGQLIHYTADATKKYCGQYVYPVV